MSLGAELQHGAAKQVELDGHLGTHGADAGHLVRGKDVERIVSEIED